MPEAQDPRLPRASARRAPANPDRGPLWARATRLFYGDSLDVRSKKAFVASMDEFVALTPGEQAFHLAQLQFRQVQALEDVHGLLQRVVTRLDGLDLGALAELPKIRRALVEMAEHQADLLELTELGGEQEEPGEPAPAEGGEEDPEFIYDDIPDEDGGDEPLEGELVPSGAEPPGVTA